MVSARTAFYNALVTISILASTSGCGGKPKAPPPGTPDDAAAPPAVELGTESGAPKEPTGGSTDSSQGTGSPQGEQGDQ